MPFDRTGSEPFHFDPDKLGKVKPTLAEADGYTLSVDDLRHIFGKLPKRLVIPALDEAWVPQVSHGKTLPASAFKTTYVKQQETITETKFNAGTSAQVNISAGGTYFRVTVEAKASSEMSFNYSSSTTTKESLETQGVQGDEPVYQLFVYPTLRCKVIKKQHIDYTINDSSAELKWTPDSYNKGYWDARWVADKRLNEIRNAAFHPVPMKGNGLGHKAYILPVPEVTESGELDVTTIMSRQAWIDWYVYDIPWQTADQNIYLAAPQNDVAFQPMSTWTTIPPIKPTTSTT